MQSIEQGYFPQIWKCMKVILLQKSIKNPKLVFSYRLISFLPIIFKIKNLFIRDFYEITNNYLIF